MREHYGHADQKEDGYGEPLNATARHYQTGGHRKEQGQDPANLVGWKAIGTDRRGLDRPDEMRKRNRGNCDEAFVGGVTHAEHPDECEPSSKKEEQRRGSD